MEPEVRESGHVLFRRVDPEHATGFFGMLGTVCE
jgi:hypothetical protein